MQNKSVILKQQQKNSKGGLLPRSVPLCRRCLCWRSEYEAASLSMVLLSTWCQSRPISSLANLENKIKTTETKNTELF